MKKTYSVIIVVSGEDDGMAIPKALDLWNETVGYPTLEWVGDEEIPDE